jgi:hypothetical protein
MIAGVKQKTIIFCQLILPFLPISQMSMKNVLPLQYDGKENIIQAQRVAYLDTFIAVLVTLSYANTDHGIDWLEQRIKDAKEWLEAQGISQPH